MKQDITTITTFRNARRGGRGRYTHREPHWDRIREYIYDDLFTNGMTIEQVRKKYCISYEVLNKALSVEIGKRKESYNLVKNRVVSLQGKRESYWYSEDEMFYQECTVDDLSPQEKEILVKI